MTTNVILIGGFYGTGKSYLTRHIAPLMPNTRVLDLGALKREANPLYEPRDSEQSAKVRKEVWDYHLPNAMLRAINEEVDHIVVAGTFSTRARRDAIVGIAEAQPDTIVHPFYLMPPMKQTLKDIRETRSGPNFMVNDSTVCGFYRNLCNDIRAGNNDDLIMPDAELVPREYRALLNRGDHSFERSKSTPWLVVPDRVSPELIAELIRETGIERKRLLLEGTLRSEMKSGSKER